MAQNPHSEPAPLSWMARSRLAAIVALGAALIAACGGGSGESDQDGGLAASSETEDSDASGDVRTIEVEMVDNEFSPDRVDVSPGETVRFVFSNAGNVTHDAVIGDQAMQAEHEDEMREVEDGEMGGMGHGSGAEGDEGAITVEPGASGELTYTFDTAAEVLIGCHEPGHYAAGMKLALDVAS